MSDGLNAYLEAKINAQLCKFPLAADRICRIGRSDASTIVLVDDLASRNHAMLQGSDSGVFYLTDLGSTNGTFVNGARISTPVVLRPGDRIQIGNYEFTFHQEAAKAPEPETVVDEKATSLFMVMRMITVLVVDIRDFTGLGQRLGSDKLGEIAACLFREAGQVLQSRGAWGQKYIGDAVMAVWVHKSHQPAVEEFQSVFDALSRLHAIAGRLQLQFGLDAPIRIGAGINTGSASIGNFGSTAASDYTALGDVVNKAFRLESATKEAGSDLMLGDKTYEFLSRAEAAAPLFRACVMKLKGYEAPITAYAGHLAGLESLVEILQRGRAPTASPR
jgi:adenylate cyclase